MEMVVKTASEEINPLKVGNWIVCSLGFIVSD